MGSLKLYLLEKKTKRANQQLRRKNIYCKFFLSEK
jgi:hypothetical protein